jgi:hypothetical protein
LDQALSQGKQRTPTLREAQHEVIRTPYFAHTGARAPEVCSAACGFFLLMVQAQDPALRG